MAARKKRKAVPEKSKAGRKKEIKRFEMETRTGAGLVASFPNEIAFVVRTSGGTPLNPTDTGKLHRLLQHELRRLGHKLKRKGQELDPKVEADASSESPAVDLSSVSEDEKRRDPDDDQPSPEALADTSHNDPAKDLDQAQAWPSADDVKAPAVIEADPLDTFNPAAPDADDSDTHTDNPTP
jgi:hypothetical protein